MKCAMQRKCLHPTERRLWCPMPQRVHVKLGRWVGLWARPPQRNLDRRLLLSAHWAFALRHQCHRRQYQRKRTAAVCQLWPSQPRNPPAPMSMQAAVATTTRPQALPSRPLATRVRLKMEPNRSNGAIPSRRSGRITLPSSGPCSGTLSRCSAWTRASRLTTQTTTSASPCLSPVLFLLSFHHLSLFCVVWRVESYHQRRRRLDCEGTSAGRRCLPSLFLPPSSSSPFHAHGICTWALPK